MLGSTSFLMNEISLFVTGICLQKHEFLGDFCLFSHKKYNLITPKKIFRRIFFSRVFMVILDTNYSYNHKQSQQFWSKSISFLYYINFKTIYFFFILLLNTYFKIENWKKSRSSSQKLKMEKKHYSFLFLEKMLNFLWNVR